MSAIADFRIIPANKIQELAEASKITIKKGLFKKTVIDNYWDFLDSNSERLEEFKHSGYIFGNLLIYLEEEKKIDLFQGEYESVMNQMSQARESTILILTFESKQKYFDSLSPENFDPIELQKFNTEFSNESEMEFVNAQLDALRQIQSAMEKLKDSGFVILITIG